MEMRSLLNNLPQVGLRCFGRHIRKAAALLLAAVLLCGCSAVPDRNMSAQPSTEESTQEVTTEETQSFVDIPPKHYELVNTDFSAKLNAEGGVYEGRMRTDGEYDGNGYVVLDSGSTLSHIVNVDTSQHYRITIAAHSYTGSAVKLRAMNETIGAFYIPKSDSTEFSMFAVDSVYLPAGADILSFESTAGSVAIDYIVVENSSQAERSCYYVSYSCAGSSTSVSALGLMKYLADSYGDTVLSGQCVTPGTNAEIDAVAAETGRSPAIRTGELMYSTPAMYSENSSTADKEKELALEWGRSGGIVSMNWHWSAPVGRASCYADSTDIILGEMITDRDISMSDTDELNALLDGGFITEDTVALLNDIDAVAEVLKQFRAESIPVLFQPIPDGDGSLYWWSGSPKNYKWLWKLIFERMDRYHSLNNLIWVWNGSSADYFPGSEYCDIIGQSFFENSSSSFAGRFSALSGIAGEVPKAMAITSCDKIPSPDNMRRDNAVWLWFSIASGNTIISSDGELSEKYNSWKSLHDIFNSVLCVTLDELPDFQEYAFQD